MASETGAESEEASIERWLQDPEWQGIEARIEDGDEDGPVVTTSEALEAWRLEALSLFIEVQTLRKEIVELHAQARFLKGLANSLSGPDIQEARKIQALAARGLAEQTRAECWKAAAFAWRHTAELALDSPELFESEARATLATKEAEEADEGTKTTGTVSPFRIIRR